MAVRKNREAIDEIMEEMEAITPRSSVNLSLSFPQAENMKISDDVDSKLNKSPSEPSTSSQPPKPIQSNFFRSFFDREEKPKKPGQIYPSKPTDERYYDYTNQNLGMALIFNQVKFKGEDERKGSSKDAQDLKNVLSNIGFAVEILEDFTTSQIRNCLSQLSKYDHSDSDCLIVTIMTHGKKEGQIFSSDGEFLVNDLWEHFIGNNCVSLIGKPKLFFIQACRGSMTDPGLIYKPKPKARALSAPSDMVDARLMRDSEAPYVIPTLADLLVMYSTSEGFYSFRNPEQGSWFIQALCEELAENSHEEIMTILTGVNRRVAYGKQSHVPHNHVWDATKQMPIIQSMLTKSLYFLNREQKEKMKQRQNLGTLKI